MKKKGFTPMYKCRLCGRVFPYNSAERMETEDTEAYKEVHLCGDGGARAGGLCRI